MNVTAVEISQQMCSLLNLEPHENKPNSESSDYKDTAEDIHAQVRRRGQTFTFSGAAYGSISIATSSLSEVRAWRTSIPGGDRDLTTPLCAANSTLGCAQGPRTPGTHHTVNGYWEKQEDKYELQLFFSFKWQQIDIKYFYKCTKDCFYYFNILFPVDSTGKIFLSGLRRQ